MVDTSAPEKQNGHATSHAPGGPGDPGVVLEVIRDRRGGRVVVLARRGDVVLASERIDLFSDEALAKLVARWTTPLFTPCNVLRERLYELRSELASQDAAEAAGDAGPRPAGSVGQGQVLTLAWPEPWGEPVLLREVLDAVAGYVRGHVVLPPAAADAVALWCAWSFVVDRGTVAPLLAITSPTKRCGKTTLLRLVGAVCPRVLLASSISPAALFRVIEEQKPTLLIDEADTFAKDNEELRGLLNSGHTRDTAFVVRCVGEDHQPRRFSTWGAKVLAAIGRLPGTVEDRAIVVRMERRRRIDQVERLTPAVLDAGRLLARKLMRWSVDSGDLFSGDDEVDVPAALDDRAADNWRPLLRLAELAGGSWPARAAAAAVALSAGRDAADEDLPTRLLHDLRAVFDQDGRAEIPTKELLPALHAIEESPWPTASRGRPLTPHKLGSLLERFGVRPTHKEWGNVYRRCDLEPAWTRYCSSGDFQSFSPSADDTSTDEIRI